MSFGYNNKPFLENQGTEEIEWYELRWGRKPNKIWTIEMLYNLLLRVNKRKISRYELRRECIREIVEKISPTIYNSRGEDKKSYIVYNKVTDSDEIRKTQIQYNDEYKCYSTSTHGYVGDSNDITTNRDDMIDYITEGDIKLELGDKLEYFDRLSTARFSAVVFKYLWSIIEEKLKEKRIYKEIFIITICGTKYYVMTDSTHRPYLEYKLGDMVVDDIEMEF